MQELRDSFLRHLRVRDGFEDATVDVYRRRWRFHVEAGLDVHGFLASPGEALEVGSRFLDARSGTTGRQGYGNSVRFLNALARFGGHDAVKFAFPKPKPAEPAALSDTEIRRLYRYQPRSEWVRTRGLAILELALCTGLRCGEIACLRVPALNLDDGWLDVENPTKMGKKRSVPILFQSVRGDSHVRKWLSMRPRARSDALWVSLAAPHGPMSRDATSMAMQRIGYQVGVRLNFYRTRHTFATRCKKAGMDIRDLQILMGHKDIKSTAIYDDRTGADVAESVQRLDFNDQDPGAR